jgi:hypothetical protein
MTNPRIIFPSLANIGSFTFPVVGTRVTTTGKQTLIDQDYQTGADIAVGDIDRCGGFYVLGQPRTRKSNLLVSMALSDIDHGHGLLFIKPHSDAINDLLARIPETRLKDVIFLDPTRRDNSFGINLLHCTDRTDPLAIEDTWGRIRDVFVKLWEQETGQLGFWVDKILRHSVYLLVETGDYTLVEVPLLLEEDTTFRNSLLEKVRYKPFVKDFWYKEIDRLTRRDRTQQVDPALNRLGRFRDNEYLRYIVGQKKSTIDFQKVMSEKKIVLLLLPANLTSDVKDALGTMVISELLYAVNERAKLDKEKRPYFGVYCYEFQDFATPDFAKLFTQTGKFGVMPVVAHQTREQFKSRDDPNRGATAASPTKAFFTLSPYDATEMPLVFTKEPPPEIRLEEQYVISQNPVRDLLHGHTNPDIRRFVNKYLRYAEDKREDIKADMEGAKFTRMIELDTAALFGAEAQEEGVLGGSHYSSQVAAIAARQSAILRARMHAVKLDALHKKSNRLRVTMRGLNRFLTEVMEGEKHPKQEAFADLLIDLAASYSAFSEAYAAVLGLYIKLSYGDLGKHRQIPFDLAKSHGLYSEEVRELTRSAEKRTEEDRRAFRARFIPEEEQVRAERRKWARERKPRDRLEAMEGRIGVFESRRGNIRVGTTGAWNYNRREDVIWYPANVYTWYMWLRLFPDIENLVIPYQIAEFTQTWKYLMADGQAAKTIAKLDESLKLLKP